MISSLELARICGVSQGTVDRALHNRRGISEKTRQRILAAAKQYGYRPNPAARELISGTSKTVGVIFPIKRSTFFNDLLHTLCLNFEDANLETLIYPASNSVELFKRLDACCARRLKAILLIPPPDLATPEAAKDIIKRSGNTPLISLINPIGKKIPCIAPDERKIGIMAAKTITKLGHSRCLHLTYPHKTASIRLRQEGFQDELKNPIEVAYTPNEVIKAYQTQKRPPTAVFCHNDWLAFQLMQTLMKNQIRVPQDLSIIGVDHTPTFVELMPNLSSIIYPIESIARNAVKLVNGDPLIPIPSPKLFKGSTIASQ